MKNKVKKILTSVLCFACIATAGIGVLSANDNVSVLPAQAYELVFTDGSALQAWYTYGSSFNAPSVTIDGVNATKAVVRMPNGKAYENQTVILNEEGTYTVIWYATVSGKTVSVEKTFKVTKEIFTTDEGSSWEYVEQIACTASETQKSGLKVSLAPESKFYFNRAIDLTQNKELPLFEIYPYNQSGLLEGYNGDKIEARTIYFTLTDCYDPSIYVTIKLEWREDQSNRIPDFSIGAVGQKSSGCIQRNETYTIKHNKEVYIDGTRYEFRYAPKIGTTLDSTNADEYGYQLFYDYGEQQFTKNSWSQNNQMLVQRLVTDLDNTDVYDTNPFEGFTTGEVYLSVYADNFEADICNIEFASIKGLSGDGFKTLIESKKEETDVKDPVLILDENLQRDNIKIALNETVKIPDATAFDLNLALGTKAEKAVYYAYNPNKTDNIRMGLKNGEFTPKKVGTYSIVYSATDKYGNVGTAVVPLECVQSPNDKAVNFNLPENLTAEAGELFMLPAYTMDGLYTDTEKVEKLVAFNGGERKEIIGNTMLLDGVGSYELTYRYATPFKTYEKSCVVTAAASDIIKIEEPVLPEYILANARYTLDTVYAKEYKTATPTKYATAVAVSVNGGAYQAIDYNDFTIAEAGTARFKYTRGETEIYSDPVKVIDVGFGGDLQKDKYFRVNETEVSCVAEKGGLNFTSLLGYGSSTLVYAQPVSLSYFSIEFTVLADILAVEDDPTTEKDETVLPVDYGTLTGVKITLTDYYDRTKKVDINYTRTGNVAWISIDEGNSLSLKRSFAGERTRIFYDEEKGGFVENSKTYAWKNGFSSDKVLLSVTMQGISDNACLNIRKLNEQSLNNRHNDDGEPTIYVSGLSNGIYELNRILDLGVAQVGDIFSPYLKGKLSLSAKAPNKEWVTSLDGIVLNGECEVNRSYQIQLSSYGTYSIMYRYQDQWGNTATLGFSIIVDDRVSPTISLKEVKDGDVIDAKVGERITLAEYTYSDDQSSKEAIRTYVTVFAPTLKTAKITNGTFLAEEKGVYTVVYSCYDANGNYVTAMYTVRVS